MASSISATVKSTNVAASSSKVTAAASASAGKPGIGGGVDERAKGKGRPDAGDVSSDNDALSIGAGSTSSGGGGGTTGLVRRAAVAADGRPPSEPQRYPINIHRRINALRHLYMDTRKREHDLQVRNFKREAETYKSLELVWKKRLEIITGQHEPTGEEGRFRLDDGNDGGPAAGEAAVQEPPTAPDDGQLGVPKFWLVNFPLFR